MKKVLLSSLLLFFTIMLTGCSLFPKVQSFSDVDEFVKENMNDKVKCTSTKCEKKRDDSGIKHIYSYEDERGIPFQVQVNYDYVIFIEGPGPIKFYESNVKITTDYIEQVVHHYETDLYEIMNKLNTNKISIDNGWILMEIPKDTDLRELAQAITEMDSMVNLDYATNKCRKKKEDSRLMWDEYNTLDICVFFQERNEVEPNDFKTVGDAKFYFSDGKRHQLTFDRVYKLLSAEYEMKVLHQDLNIYYIDHTFYYEAGEINTGIPARECDGTIDYKADNFPRDNGVNFPRGSEYWHMEDDTVILHYVDGSFHLLKLYEP